MTQTEKEASAANKPKKGMPRNKMILIIACVVVAAVGLYFGISAAIRPQRHTLEIGDVFSGKTSRLSFGMTRAEVIEYEAVELRETEYDYNAKRRELSFSPAKETNGKMFWKHVYVFDENDQLSWFVFMDDLDRTHRNPLEWRCAHLEDLLQGILGRIGHWDRVLDNGNTNWADATFGGEPCTIRYLGDETNGHSLTISKK